MALFEVHVDVPVPKLARDRNKLMLGLDCAGMGSAIDALEMLTGDYEIVFATEVNGVTRGHLQTNFSR